MSLQPLADAQARTQALDPRSSFIVQAPAGSGKTGLLTLRFLKLLSLVKQPEEVVAITFTRKAAAEMKSRILEALDLGMGTAPQEPFQYHMWQLAVAVARRAEAMDWDLTDNPGRLRIVTIDSLCASLARQMPVLSRLGGAPHITTDPKPLYVQAARATLDYLSDEGERGQAVTRLLDHLDNNLEQAESLLADMLSRRDQWLRHITGRRGEEIRSVLEQTLLSIVQSQVNQLASQISPTQLAATIRLAQQAASMLPTDERNKKGGVSEWLECDAIPDSVLAALPAWLGLADLLLTANGTWRKNLTAKLGFPPQSQGKNSAEKTALKKHKAQAVTLIEQLSSSDEFRRSLHQIRLLPPIHYTEDQWHILSALLTLLPIGAAHLKLHFAQLRKVDFTEVSQSALTALGEPDQPTDLALKLDYGIAHLLVDEFQDTSRSQFDLLQRIIAGWEESEGNTLFLVGDPMQSIYRFREAEVGLFLQARRNGIAPINLIPLTLSVNFRSEAGIVNWVNNAMAEIFPSEEQLSVGAVPYSESVSFHPVGEEMAVEDHPLPPQDRLAEAGRVAALASQARGEGLSVAVLVRSRSHLAHILPAFDEAGLRYQAVELHPLAGQPMIQDLLALTRALSHPADRIAWLALLRAPWCGLSLADIHQLVGEDQPENKTVWQQMQCDASLERISTEGQRRLLRVRGILAKTVEMRGRGGPFAGAGGWRRWIEGCWLALGGPATLEREAQLLDARTFFDLLEREEEGGEEPVISRLQQSVEALYGATDPQADPQLMVMTLHKAKGLEFDVVILPGLDRRPRGESRQLLTWLDSSLDESVSDLPLLAPIGRSDQESGDAIQNYIKTVEKQKNTHETNRLLYVAVTRAKKKLHLLSATVDEDKTPPPHSFLATLWPVLSEPFTTSAGEDPPLEEQPGGAELLPRSLSALKPDWQPPELPPIIPTFSAPPSTEEQVLFDWAGESARVVGLVVHRFLCRIVAEGLAQWPQQRVSDQQETIAAHLRHLGLSSHEILVTVSRVQSALQQTLADRRGRWILDANHQESQSELAMSALLAGRKHRLVIDRCFVDGEGVRWIIDYKTSFHAGGDLEGFLDNERIRYQDQLNRYGALFATREKRPIRLGLYFPMLSAWREWSYGETF
ncbi:MAG: UvrD-helicase domain-containing protein [Magnetococcales bacterium]|nr:UvrD-helicase domain-containing protein [Magnetococcales bacterium]